jgi:SAM-dependent methyltransferase
MSNVLQGFYENKYRDGIERPRSSKVFTLDCVPAEGNLVVLDIGCGTGENSRAIVAKGHRVCGVDISENAIVKYRAHGFDGRAMDIERGLDFPDASFDLLFCSEVIEHLAAPERLASEAFRVLVPGGKLILSTPNSAFWIYRVVALLGRTLSEVQHPKHLQFFSRRSLNKLLKGAGFCIDQEFGRNMYVLLPDLAAGLGNLPAWLGFQKEERFRTKSYFWHWSHRSSVWNTLWADTLICVMSKPAPPA